ncbi:hypothetical protein F4677DRAFT_434967 [Hypoxylon crocopeplum]|nr:hypothetical protein F4677DRAFT_434967 [Hypoxylon crocopeplum]
MHWDSLHEDDKSELIDSWIQSIIDTNRNQTTPTYQKRAAHHMSSPPRSPSPSKRRRIQQDSNMGGNSRAGLDEDDVYGDEGFGADVTTPRPVRATARRIDLRGRPPRTPTSGSTGASGDANVSVSDNQSETASSISQRSGRSSPVKREAAMRRADDLPLHRRPVDQVLTAADASTTQLIKDLSRIRQKMGILPASLKTELESRETIQG